MAPTEGDRSIGWALRRTGANLCWPSLLAGGGLVVLLAALAQNVGNLVFHALASQSLGTGNYGALGAVLTLTVAFTVPLGALQVAITRGVAEGGGTVDPRRILVRVLRAALAAALGVALLAPLVKDFLQLGSIALPLLLAPYTLFAAVAAAGRGAAIGRGRLRPAAASMLAATVVRLIAGAVALWWLGAVGAMLATIGAEVVGATIALRAALTNSRGAAPVTLGINALIETSAVTAGIWMLASVDVLLARHYLPADAAGLYVAAGTATRAVLVLPQALLMIAMPRFVDVLAAGSGRVRDAWNALWQTATLALVLTGLGAVAMGLLGPAVLRMAFGINMSGAQGTVWLLALGSLPAALAAVHATYELARHSRLALLPWLGAAAEVLAIARWHSSTSAVAAAALLGVSLQAVLLLVLIAHGRARTRRDSRASPSLPAVTRRSGLRILIFNWRDLAHPSAGGAEVYVEEVARRWVAAGHVVTIFCAAVSGRPDRETVHGVNIVRRGSRLGVYREARRYWRSEGNGAFDLVIDSINTRPFGTPRFVRGAPVVALAYQVCREIWSFESPRPIAVLGRFILEPHWLRRYRQVPTMTISASSRSSLASYGLQDLHLVPVGMKSPSIASLPPRRSEPTLVVCGRLVRSKRIDHAIDAFVLVRERLPTCRLIVVGSGPDEQRLKDNAPEGVEFAGRVDEATKLRLMAEAHLLVATSMREGWGLTVSEAATVGTPTVAYDVPGLRDSTAAAGGRTSAPNPAALADVILEALPAWMANPPRPIPWGGASDWGDVADRVLLTALSITGVQTAATPVDSNTVAPRFAPTPLGVGHS